MTRSLKVAVLTDRPDKDIVRFCGVADVLVTLGDLYPSDVPEVAIPRVYVYGNHDSPSSPFAPAPNRHHAHLQVVEVGGVRFGGYQGSHRYKPKGHYLYDDEQAAAELEAFPAVDVFLSHATPTCLETAGDEVHRGTAAFDDYLRRTRPAYALSGHVHASRVTRQGDTVCMSFFRAALIELRL